MSYEPPQGWVETRADGNSRRVHGNPACERIRPGSTLTGPMLIGIAASGKSTSVCKCAGKDRYSGDGRRPRWEISGGLPTLGRRR